MSFRAPNPRRVAIFVAEKELQIPQQMVNLGQLEHRSADYLERNPFGRVPALELDDGRVLAETRAICTYLEGLQPEPNLMGRDATERAFIEMADRRMELHLFAGFANCIRHTHPGLALLESPQFPEFGAVQGERVRDTVRWLDDVLAHQPYVAGERFTIADITGFCALEFARGLMKFRPGQEGFANVQAWRDRIAERPAASAGG